jgi:hypothetical protein
MNELTFAKFGIYFGCIIISIGLGIRSFLLINIGLVPLMILALFWGYNSLKTHRINLLKKKEEIKSN